MAGEWRDITLGEFVRLQRGHDLTEAARRPGLVQIMGSAGHNGFHDTAKAPDLASSLVEAESAQWAL
jgi:type I restriction enzyme S subunit